MRWSSQRERRGENQKNRKPRKVSISKKRGSAILGAKEGMLGKNIELAIEFAPWKSLMFFALKLPISLI